MKLNKLLKRFLEETNILKDKRVMLLMVYGSRITNNSTKNSDLDILIITSEVGSYKASRLIDGIPIDMTIASIDDAQREIIMSKATGSSFFKSVLKTGQIVLDRYDTYNNLLNELNYQVKRNRLLNPKLFELALNHITDFMSNTFNKDVNYFTALEFLRRLYHAQNNCSNIHVTKVYDLYKDKDRAKEKYMAKLPDEDFIKNYLSALKENDYNKRKEYLMKFLKSFETENIRSVIANNDFLNKNEIMKKLVILNNAVIKCETMLLENHPYANVLYFILIGELKSIYNQIYSQESIDFIKCYKNALKERDKENRIRVLENLFCLTDYEYRIDYNDFMLKL